MPEGKSGGDAKRLPQTSRARQLYRLLQPPAEARGSIKRSTVAAPVLPKGHRMRVHSAEQIAAVAVELNAPPFARQAGRHPTNTRTGTEMIPSPVREQYSSRTFHSHRVATTAGIHPGRLGPTTSTNSGRGAPNDGPPAARLTSASCGCCVRFAGSTAVLGTVPPPTCRASGDYLSAQLLPRFLV